MQTIRQQLSQGGRGKSAFTYSVEAIDLGNVNAGGALTIRQGGVLIPLVNSGQSQLKLQDNYPSQDPGGLLTAASGDRQVGTGVAPFCYLAGVYVYHSTAAGAVYQPAAGTTVKVRVQSSAAAVGGAFTDLTAAFALATAANFVDAIAITAPAARQVGVEGLAQVATVAALFNGDVLFVELTTTGPVNVQGNNLTVFLEMIF